MNHELDVIAGVGLDQRTRKSHWPARLDFVQSASGLFLGLFMWGHMAFVSTILISNDAMWWVTKMFEGQFILGKAYPAIVSFVVAIVSVMFVLHGLLAMRKFPANWNEYRSFASHRKILRHEDTTLWWVQACTLVISAPTNRRSAFGLAAGGRCIWFYCSRSSCTAVSVFTGWQSNGVGSRAKTPIGRASCSSGSNGESRFSF
jgi:succinate dehydrogenase/fumarate reductase cytochrome b subunit